MLIGNNSGGMYVFRKELITELISKGNEISVLTPFDDSVDDLRQLGAVVIKTPISRRGINPFVDIKLFLFYFRLIKKNSPDYVITYTIKPNVYAGLVCRLLKKKYAINITGLGTAFQKDGLLKRLVIAMYKMSCKKARVVFFENSGNQKVFIEQHIVTTEQTCLLNGAGVNLEHYSYNEYPEDDGETRFLFIGRVMKEKGIDELFEAMRKLVADGIKCSLDVVGHYEDDYENVIKACENEGWLRYHGYQKDVRPFIAECHCFILPSWHEGMANTNLECAACGRPVITSNIHGCMEAVEDGVSGYLCEKQNAEDLHKFMKKMCNLSNEQRAVMGMSGRKRMEAVFDKKKVVMDTINGLMDSYV